MDFVHMLNDIKEKPELLDVYNDQCLLWWNKKDLINLIKNIISKYFDKKSNTYNISIQFQMSLQSLIDRPKELLELITDCLKPKDIEKKDMVGIILYRGCNMTDAQLQKYRDFVQKDKSLSLLGYQSCS